MNPTDTNFQDRRTPPGEAQPKRLFKFHEGSLIAGVCSGLGVYFNIDPTIIRVVFILATFFHGVGIIVYLFMMIIVPYAKTPEEFAQAKGDRVNPYGKERRHDDPTIVNSHAYWRKIAQEQASFWREFLEKILSPMKHFFEKRHSK